MTVLGYRIYDDDTYITAKSRETSITHALLPSDIHHRAPEPADSWEKLEEDMMRGTSSRYFGCDESRKNCRDCPPWSRAVGNFMLEE